MTPEEARLIAAKKKASFLESVEAVQKKVGVETDRVESAIEETQKLKSTVDGYVRAHPWVFVLGAVALGVALGSRPARRRPSEREYDRGGVVSAVADGLASQLGKILEKLMMSAFDELKRKWFEGRPTTESPSDSAEPKP
ncbi:MAG: hypothetical protein HY791_39835 [Deltaproteobacteria bacterium]|nr:hypothetical protein [Deltaproteobacteria bacterium]